jgi:hypothetical protein
VSRKSSDARSSALIATFSQGKATDPASGGIQPKSSQCFAKKPEKAARFSAHRFLLVPTIESVWRMAGSARASDGAEAQIEL